MSASKAPGRETYRPESFDVLVDDAVKSIQTGLADGCRRMEVEYPLSSDTSGYKDASDSFIDANIALAISAAKRLSEGTDLKICVLVPDGPELVRASKRFEPALELAGDNVTLGCMAGKKKGAFGGFFGGAVGSGELVEDYNDNDIFIAVNASTVELPTVRKYTEEVVKDRTMILWCLELDTLRADLGLFGFPGKEIQFEFLSQFKSMFYIRQRAYSKSVEVAPFLVNYNGALFREYPGPWQAMIKQDNGELACIAERDMRYDLGELKEELLEIMGLNTEAQGSTAAFLRRGYKTATWWEEDKESETSDMWRR